MATDQWGIRLVRPEDNVVLAQVLREVLIEMKVPFDRSWIRAKTEGYASF